MANIPGLSDHLVKLYRICEGALRACENELQPEQRERNKRWWDGYRQALDDISHFLGVPPRAAPPDPEHARPQ
jgi:hypothetical protein